MVCLICKLKLLVTMTQIHFYDSHQSTSGISIRCTVLVLSYFPFGPGNHYSLLLSLILFPCDMVGTFLLMTI